MSDRMRRIHRIHFVGIGGSGMGGIAEVLAQPRLRGAGLGPASRTPSPSGWRSSARASSSATRRRTSAAPTSSSSPAPWRRTTRRSPRALRARIPVVPRAEMLGELMRFRYAIAVAGTHGKTTTTSLVASILAEGGEDPTFVIGGLLKSAGSNARLGAGRYLVAEADESDASFLHLQPMIAIVTNIDNDHLGTHDGDFERLKQSFVEFLHNLPFYGLAVLCIDDAHVRSILPQVGRPVVGYGFSRGRGPARREHRAATACGRTSTCVRRADATPLAVTVNLPGMHNVLNSLAAIAVALELGDRDEAIQRALAEFQGIDRRLQHVADVDLPGGGDASPSSTTTAITRPRSPRRSTRCARATPGRRLVLAFQPHRYTRTRDLIDDFGTRARRRRRAAGHRGVRRRRSSRSRRRRPRHLPRGAQPRPGRAGVRRESRDARRGAARRAQARRRDRDDGRRHISAVSHALPGKLGRPRPGGRRDVRIAHRKPRRGRP